MVIALIFFIIQYVLNFIVRTSGDPSINNNAPASISAHSAYVLVLQQFLYCVSNQYRLGFNDLGTNINEYAVFISWISFALNIVFWLLLTLYLDQVFPNEWGAKKSPLFCFQCPKKSKSR
jgi:ATP-binding cassette subfamily A (ABC1) protein 3